MLLIGHGLAILASAAAGVAAPLARPVGADTSPYVAELSRCQAIADDNDRLRCFDASVGQLLEAKRAGQLSVIDQQQAKEVRRSLFGFAVPKLRILGGGDTEEASQITAKVVQVRARADGRYHLTLEDGAIWETVQRPNAGEGPRRGSTIHLRKAALGSYFMNIDGNRAVRARRVE